MNRKFKGVWSTRSWLKIPKSQAERAESAVLVYASRRYYDSISKLILVSNSDKAIG
jgi:hypothetical protein